MPTVPDILRKCEPAERAALVRGLPDELAGAALRAFGEWAHGGQMAPAGDWRTWVLMAGRGFGKTRAGAEWVLERVRGEESPSRLREGSGVGEGARTGLAHPRPLPLAGGEELGQASRLPQAGGEPVRIALVAATVGEARRVMVEGASGILACARPGEIVDWSPSRGELVLAGGAVATLFSGANPEALRGPQHHLAWCDELAKWRHPQAAWDMLQLGLRCGELPRALVTTTPRGGCAALGRILASDGTVLTRGTSRDNPHLPAAFLRAVEAAYGGTRMGREEIDGELLDDIAGSLWPVALLEASRGPAPAAEDLVRVVVGVDPPASAEGTCGIVACGLDRDGVGWVLGDHSQGGLSPEGWARKVAAAVETHAADRVIAEKNQGGEMVLSVLRAAGIVLPVTMASASQSKPARAEPVAGLFECGRARLAGRFPELEEQLGRLVPVGYAGAGRSTARQAGGAGSPDRADAMVWALWALLIAPRSEPRVRVL